MAGRGFRTARRGSPKRLRRITLRGNSSLELWILLVLIAVILVLVLPWVMRHPPPMTHDHAFGEE